MNSDPLGLFGGSVNPSTAPTPNSGPAPAKDQTSSVLLMMLIGVLVFVAWQNFRPDGGDDRDRDDRQDTVRNLTGARLIFVTELQNQTADNLEVWDAMPAIEKETGLLRSMKLDEEMREAESLIAFGESAGVKPPLMVLIDKDRKNKLAVASFPETGGMAAVTKFLGVKVSGPRGPPEVQPDDQPCCEPAQPIRPAQCRPSPSESR